MFSVSSGNHLLRKLSFLFKGNEVLSSLTYWESDLCCKTEISSNQKENSNNVFFPVFFLKKGGYTLRYLKRNMGTRWMPWV